MKKIIPYLIIFLMMISVANAVTLIRPNQMNWTWGSFFDSSYWINSQSQFIFNETKLNETIDAREIDTNTRWDISTSNYLINNSGVLDWNETKGNSTYVNADGDTMTGPLIVNGDINGSDMYKGGVLVATVDDLTGATNISVTNIQVIRNDAGVILTALTPVKFTGYNVGTARYDVQLSDNTNTANHADCMVLSTIGVGGTGNCVVDGTIDSVDTSMYSIEDDLYLNESAGTLTTARPTTAVCVQKIAQVIRVHGSLGVVWVSGAGRCNDIPNNLNVNQNVSAQHFFGNLTSDFISVTNLEAGNIIVGNITIGSGGINLSESDLNVNNVFASGDVNATNLNGNLSWSYLKDFPTECPFGFAVTENADSNICSVFINAGDNTYLYRIASTLFLNETKLNSTIDTKITALNASLVSYIDAQDIVFNNSMKVYVDAQDIIFNDSMKSYIDGEITTVDTKIDTLNTSLQGQIDNKLNNSGDATLTGNLTVTGEFSAGGFTSLGSDVNITGDLTVGGGGTFQTNGVFGGNMVIDGNLTVLGTQINATVENQILNGTFKPAINNLFDIGTTSFVWANGYFTNIIASTLLGSLDVSNLTNVDNLADTHTHDASNITSPIWLNSSGGSLTGNVNMTGNNITNIQRIDFQGGGFIFDNGTTLILGHD